jgi:predicted 2-oxoglutarate/Fe(II)-dependent dioxygenase YbiX
MPLTPGEPAPWFRASTPSNPEFTFDSTAGRYILLAFLPPDQVGAAAMVRALAANRPMFDDAKLSAFGVVGDRETAATMQDMRGIRWVLDFDGAVRRLYGVLGEDGAEAELCEQLIALHAADGGTLTGVMRDAGDRTVAVMDELKRRRDVLVSDAGLQATLRERLERRLFPQIERTLGFKVTHIERFVVGCYAADDGGVFHAHRDDVTQATAHRRFACSINLNDDFAGGDLRFPEFGTRTYRPPPGGAVVFSCKLLHEATRITAGRRYAFLPFFHDDAGEAVRQTYEQRSAAQPAAPAP